jgi:hypothetical protein
VKETTMNKSTARRLLVAFLLVVAFGVSTPPPADAGQKTVHVKGYTKKEGTIVAAHDRKAPNAASASSSPSRPAAAPSAPSYTPRPAVGTSAWSWTPKYTAGAVAPSSIPGRPLRATAPSSRPRSAVGATPSIRRSNRCQGCDRDERGRILRSGRARQTFGVATGYPHGRPGYVIDHIMPLACGGADMPSNMQWQTTADAKAKDQHERKDCR